MTFTCTRGLPSSAETCCAPARPNKAKIDALATSVVAHFDAMSNVDCSHFPVPVDGLKWAIHMLFEGFAGSMLTFIAFRIASSQHIVSFIGDGRRTKPIPSAFKIFTSLI